MIPYFNMISQDSNSRRRRANEAQAAEIYQSFRQAARLLHAAANALWRLVAVSVQALHRGPQKTAKVARRDASQSSPC